MTVLLVLIIAIWALTYIALRRAQKAGPGMPLDDLPVVFLLVLCIYGTLPPLLWVLQGGEYLSILSGRLFGWQPGLHEHVYLVGIAALLASGVVASQFVVPARYRNVRHRHMAWVPKRVAIVCLAIIAAQFALVAGLRFAGIIRPSASYVDSYLAIQELPLALRQILKILTGLSFLAKLIVLVWLFQRWRTHRLWVYGFVAFTLLSIDPDGGRAGLMIPMFAILVLWNRYVRPVSLAQLSVIGVVGLLVFTALGIYRGLSGSGLEGIGVFDTGLGEFDTLWANAIELRRERLAGTPIPTQLLVSEFVGPIPSNVLPFEKTSFSQWYLDRFYPEYRSAGGGLMFGILAQVVIGYGLPEAFIRGFVVGLFLAALTYFFARGTRWWQYPALLYCAVWSFQAVRDSSFALITPLVQAVAFGVVTIMVLATLLPRRNSAPGTAPAPLLPSGSGESSPLSATS